MSVDNDATRGPQSHPRPVPLRYGARSRVRRTLRRVVWKVPPGPWPADLEGRQWYPRVRNALRRAAPALALYVTARVAGTLVLALWAWHTGKDPLRLLGHSWDSVWYARIADRGYGTVVHTKADPTRVFSDLAFFPLYPTLVRAVRTVLSLDFVHAGLLVSWTAAVVAAWGIYAVGERLHGRRVATLLVALWGLLPHAIIQSMAYSESLMTALAAWALYAVLTGRWLWAGGLAVFAGLARPNGIAVAAAVSLAAVWHLCVLWRGRSPTGRLLRAGQIWRPGTSAILAPLGWSGYVLWVGWQKNDPLFGYFQVQRKWGSEFDFGQDALESVRLMVLGHVRIIYPMTVAVAALAVVLLMMLVLDRPPLALVVYSAVLLVLALGTTRFFGVKPRFLLPAFPLLLPVAIGMAKARRRTVAVTIGALAGLSFCYGTYVLALAITAP